jgi:predicted transposase/invertase (TIGR01784 family)
MVFKEKKEDAMDILEKGSWSSKELAAYDKYWDYVRTEKSRTETALEKGIKKGLEKGIAKGIALGKQQAKIELVKELLKLYDVSQVAKITKLSIDEVRKIK